MTNFVSATEMDELRKVKTAVIGPVTAGTLKMLGINVDISAETYTIAGLVEAIQKYFK